VSSSCQITCVSLFRFLRGFVFLFLSLFLSHDISIDLENKKLTKKEKNHFLCMWVRVCSSPFVNDIQNSFTLRYIRFSRINSCHEIISVSPNIFFFVFLKSQISRVSMVNESIPMDDDDDKKKEKKLTWILLQKQKNGNRRRCILYICEPVHLYNFCSRIVTYTLLVFLGKPTRLSAFKIYSRFSWSIKKHFRKEKRQEMSEEMYV
jgi:hypothetical protein